MSLTISSTPDPYQTSSAQNGNYTKVRSDFQQLSDALASGSVDKAQQALGTLQSDLPSGASNSPLGKALGAVGQALQSGDLTAAQQAFAALQQPGPTPGTHHHHHHHHAAGAGSSPVNSSSTTDGPTSSVGTTVNVTA